MADAGFLELEFADGKRGVDQPFADWILQATGGDPSQVTFKQAMKMVNNRPLKNVLRGIERQVYREHFRIYGD